MLRELSVTFDRILADLGRIGRVGVLVEGSSKLGTVLRSQAEAATELLHVDRLCDGTTNQAGLRL
jgi:hypothetical protein